MILWSDIEKSMELHKRQAEAKRKIEEIRKRQEDNLKKFHIDYKNIKTRKVKERE